MNNEKSSEQIKNHELKKKELILKIQKEIKQLEFNLKHSKLSNLKINLLRTWKIYLLTLQAIAPYVLAATITFGAFSSFVSIPFYRENKKKKLQMKEVIDSFGNIRYEQQYEKFSNASGTISYVDKWEKRDDGLYTRKVSEYSFGKIEESIVRKIVSDGDFTTLDDIFGFPINLRTEIRNNLTEEEIRTQPYLEAVIYSRDDNDFIIVKESVDSNMGLTAIWIFAACLAEIVIINFRSWLSTFNFKDSLDRIKEEYPLIDTDELIKKLEIKQSNYNRLTR